MRCISAPATSTWANSVRPAGQRGLTISAKGMTNARPMAKRTARKVKGAACSRPMRVATKPEPQAETKYQARNVSSQRCREPCIASVFACGRDGAPWRWLGLPIRRGRRLSPRRHSKPRRCGASPGDLARSIRRLAPQLGQARIAAAAGAVVLVAQRIFQVVVLVVVLGRPEGGGAGDFGDDFGLEGF